MVTLFPVVTMKRIPHNPKIVPTTKPFAYLWGGWTCLWVQILMQFQWQRDSLSFWRYYVWISLARIFDTCNKNISVSWKIVLHSDVIPKFQQKNSPVDFCQSRKSHKLTEQFYTYIFNNQAIKHKWAFIIWKQYHADAF